MNFPGASVRQYCVCRMLMLLFDHFCRYTVNIVTLTREYTGRWVRNRFDSHFLLRRTSTEIRRFNTGSQLGLVRGRRYPSPSNTENLIFLVPRSPWFRSRTNPIPVKCFSGWILIRAIYGAARSSKNLAEHIITFLKGLPCYGPVRGS